MQLAPLYCTSFLWPHIFILFIFPPVSFMHLSLHLQMRWVEKGSFYLRIIMRIIHLSDMYSYNMKSVSKVSLKPYEHVKFLLNTVPVSDNRFLLISLHKHCILSYILWWLIRIILSTTWWTSVSHPSTSGHCGQTQTAKHRSVRGRYFSIFEGHEMETDLLMIPFVVANLVKRFFGW